MPPGAVAANGLRIRRGEQNRWFVRRRAEVGTRRYLEESDERLGSYVLGATLGLGSSAAVRAARDVGAGAERLSDGRQNTIASVERQPIGCMHTFW